MYSVFNIPKFIKASSPKGLRGLALKEQVKVSGQIIWMGAPLFDGKAWYLWYVVNAENELLTEEIDE